MEPLRQFAVAGLLLLAFTSAVGGQKVIGGQLGSDGDGHVAHRVLHAGHHSTSPAGCTITFQGGPLSFQICKTDPSGFIFRWNDLENRAVQVAITDQHGLAGWTGFGIGEGMVGSSAVVAFPTVGGVYANQYFLGGKNESQVTPGQGSLQLGNGGVLAEFSDNLLTMLFNLTLSEDQHPESDVIFARGPPGDGTTGRIAAHFNKYKAKINWELGTEEEGGDSLTKAHGFLMVLVWAILFPAGIISARFFRHLDPLWFNLHRGIQGVGFFFFVIAWGLGWLAKAKKDEGMNVHLAFAFLLPIMVVLQISATVFRPKKDAENRPLWNQYHHWMGRSAVILALINIYVGLYLYGAESSAVSAYTFVWVVVLLVFVGLELYWRLRGPWSVGYSKPTEIDLQSLDGNQREGFLKL